MAEQEDYQETGLPDIHNKDDSSVKDEKKAKKTKKSRKNEKVDDELSELLDSALADFSSCRKDDAGGFDQTKTPDDGTKPSPPSMLWDEEYLRQVAERLQQSFQSGFSAGDTPLTAEQLGQNIQSLAEAVTHLTGSEASPDIEFPNIFAQTLKQLSEVPEPSRTQLSEEEVKNMMTSIGNCSENSEFAGMLPLILSMVQNLLSKEVLYADLKSITEKYPQWLEENKAKLPSHEYERHTKKLDILRDVCTEFEKETPGESDDVKKERCDRLLMLLLQVQDLGSMPSEIAGDLSPMLGVETQGFPQLPSNISPNQCCIA